MFKSEFDLADLVHLAAERGYTVEAYRLISGGLQVQLENDGNGTSMMFGADLREEVPSMVAVVAGCVINDDLCVAEEGHPLFPVWHRILHGESREEALLACNMVDPLDPYDGE